MPERNNREHAIDMSPAASYDPLGALFTAQKLEDYAAASAAAGDKALAAAAYSAAANELTRAAATHAGSMLGAAGLVASASTLLRKSTTIRVAAEQSRPWSPQRAGPAAAAGHEYGCGLEGGRPARFLGELDSHRL